MRNSSFFPVSLLRHSAEQILDRITTIENFNTSMSGLDIDSEEYIRGSKAIEALFHSLHFSVKSLNEFRDQCSHDHWERMEELGMYDSSYAGDVTILRKAEELLAE